MATHPSSLPSPSESCQQNLCPPSKRGRLDADTEDEPAFFTLFSRQDIIHRILFNQVATPYQGAVAVPAAGTGGEAAAISYQQFVQFLDRVAIKVGMTQKNFAEDIRRQREPGVFHGVPQHVADRYENELDSYSWNLVGGLSAGKLYKVVPGFALQKRAGPFQ